VSQAWNGPRAPIVRMLPELFPYTELPAPASDSHSGLPIGIDEDALAPVYLEFATDSHFMVFGDTQSGKTNLLRAIATGIAQKYTPDQAKIIFMDYRYGLLDAVSTPHKIAHGFSSNHAGPIVRNVVEAMTKRLPPEDISPERLRARDWWSGADLYLIVDDYDLVSTGMTNPLAPLLEFLPQARDIGLHLIIARAMGGAGRAMFEQVIQRMKEIGTPMLIMSGNKDEGILAGTVKPEPLPAGRGRLVTRRNTRLIQTAYLPPPAG
jgi:S-DNA-T family DNA segregation ATPase FtsK/SpoIIIE